MNTTFIINGGAGRVITSIPALEKFHRLHPDNDFKVLVHGWDPLLWGHPILQSRTFSVNQKGVFDYFIKNNKIICPEPYYVHGYYNQKLSLAEAFDVDINQTEDHTDLSPPRLYVSTMEKTTIKKILGDLLQQNQKKKILVFQPYGSGLNMIGSRPYDNSHRSLDVDDYLKIVTRLNKENPDLLIIYFGPKDFRHPLDKISISMDQFNADLRMYMAIINEANYFVGCDSVGQHMTRSLNKRGLVIMGSTSEINVSYPGYFNFYRNKSITPTYSPIRIAFIDSEFADRANDGIMRFDDNQIEEICQKINFEMNVNISL